MCKVGDIILLEKYNHKSSEVDRHSFIVLSTKNGQIGGLEYNLTCNVLSSLKNEKQKKKKLSYPGNFEIKNKDEKVIDGNSNDGYVKAEQIYYFDTSITEFRVIGMVTPEFFNDLIEFINNLKIDLEHITDNLANEVTNVG